MSKGGLMMYSELILRPSGFANQVIYPDLARKFVAAALNGVAVDPALFARDADGRTLQGVMGHVKDGGGFGRAPKIVTDGGAGFLRIYGIGQDGSDLLIRHLGHIYASISQKYGPTVQELRQGQCRIDLTGYMTTHRIRLLVVNKRPHFRAQEIEGNEQAVNLIRRQIVAGLVSQAELVGCAQKLPRDEEIDVLEATPYPIPIREGIFASGYKNVVFAMPSRLIGPWLAGHLRSRGYGFMRAQMPNGGAR
jgi:hypothetical protein